MVVHLDTVSGEGGKQKQPQRLSTSNIKLQTESIGNGSQHAPSHLDRSPEKDAADLNIFAIRTLLDTFHPEISDENDKALLNIPSMLITEETSHFDKSPSNEAAYLNMSSMVVTDVTFHELIFSDG